MIIPSLLLSILLVGQDDASRTAEDIVRELERIYFPQHSGGADPESIARFHEQVREASDQTQALALELFELAPEHEAVPKWMQSRWSLMVNVDHNGEGVLAETERALERYEGKALGVIALYQQAYATIETDRFDRTAKLAAVSRFEEVAPGSESWARLLWMIAEEHSPSPEAKKALAERIVGSAPEKIIPRKRAQALLDAAGRIGQPFALHFKDALSGEPVSIEDFRGQVVVVLFWGAGELHDPQLPRMKRLIDEHADTVAVIGVMQGASMHDETMAKAREAGLPTFDELAAEDATPWSCFSHEQGIRRWPQAYVIDRAGRLAAVQAIETLEDIVARQVRRR
ncbi:MAG: redoxin domain-containing protein [Planctomycetota bacterium]